MNEIQEQYNDPRFLKNNKIRLILDETGMNALTFAEKIKVQRSTLSHILAYRNRPSQEVLERIVAWNEKYSFDWFRTEYPEETKRVKELLERQGYGHQKPRNESVPESREKSIPGLRTGITESRGPQNRIERPQIAPAAEPVQAVVKQRRAVLITIVYDDQTTQVIPVDQNSKLNQHLWGQ